MKEEVKWVSEAMKFTNSRLHSLEKLNEAMFNALTRLVDLEADKQQVRRLRVMEARAILFSRNLLLRVFQSSGRENTTYMQGLVSSFLYCHRAS